MTLTQPTRPRLDFREIDRVALANAHDLIERWLPGGRWVGGEYAAINPGRHDRSLGSFKVNARTGVFKDFASGEKGGRGLIALYAYTHRVGRFEAARAVAAAIGLDIGPTYTNGAPGGPVTSSAEISDRQAAADRAASEDTERRIDKARKLAGEAEPVDGTVGEQYLTQTRAIPRPADGWPGCVGFHRPSSALLFIGTTDAGAIQCVQRIGLTADAQKRPGPNGRGAKWTNGVMKGAPCRLPPIGDGSDLPTYLQIAEGPETALSAWCATRAETWIAFGGLGQIEPPPQRRHVVLCADDDAAGSPAEIALHATIARWRATGHHARIALPWAERRHDKTDLNDTIKAGGPEAVRARVERARFPDGRPWLNADQARPILTRAISDFIDKCADYDPQSGDPPPVDAVCVTVGGGKSSIGRQLLVRFLIDMRARDDMRTIVVAVPHHRLSAEAAAGFNDDLAAAGATHLKAEVWRGRTASDPTAPGNAMCRDLDRIKDARTAGVANIQAACCRGTTPSGDTAICPVFELCGYQGQPRQADVWYCAHELLFSALPTNFGEVALLVVDEGAWRAGIEGDQGRPITLTTDSFDVLDRIPGDRLATERLHFLRRRAVDAIRDTLDGPALRANFLWHGLTGAMAHEARGLEWRLNVRPEMHPGMSAAQRKAALHAVEANATVRRRSRFWDGVMVLLADGGPGRSGLVTIATETGEDGSSRVIHLKWRREIAKGWRVPTLLTDALLDMDIVRHFWPQANETAHLRIAAPHQRIRQTNRPYSMRQLIDDPARDTPAELARKHKARRRLHAIICREARGTPRRVLVIAQMALEAAIAAEFPALPANVTTAHHNDIAGRDEWREIGLLILVGRTSPKVADVGRTAEALTGIAVVPPETWHYPKVAAERELTDGSFVPIQTDRNPDPAAEAIRWQTCEGGAIQGIGRGRGINRTSLDPLDVLVLTDVHLPIPVDEVIDDAELDPSPIDLMLAQGGVAFDASSAAHKAYGDIWPTLAGAKAAMRRWADRPPTLGWGRYDAARSDTKPIKESSNRKSGQPRGCVTITYRLPGPGKSPETAFYLPGRVAHPVDEVAARLGAIPRWLHIDEPEPPEWEAQDMADVAPVAAAEAEPLPAPVPVPQPAPLGRVRPLGMHVHVVSLLTAHADLLPMLGVVRQVVRPQRPP